MVDETLLEAEEKMERTIEVAYSEFSGIRSGRTNAAIFSAILVDYYGAPTPLQQLGAITAPEARTVLITPFDRPVIASIDKALREFDLEVSLTGDGNLTHVVLSALTEKRRCNYVKLARNKAEEARVAVREIRRKAREALDKIKKDGEAGEDDVRRIEEKSNGLTKCHTGQVNEALKSKEKELLKV